MVWAIVRCLRKAYSRHPPLHSFLAHSKKENKYHSWLVYSRIIARLSILTDRLVDTRWSLTVRTEQAHIKEYYIWSHDNICSCSSHLRLVSSLFMCLSFSSCQGEFEIEILEGFQLAIHGSYMGLVYTSRSILLLNSWEVKRIQIIRIEDIDHSSSIISDSLRIDKRMPSNDRRLQALLLPQKERVSLHNRWAASFRILKNQLGCSHWY